MLQGDPALPSQNLTQAVRSVERNLPLDSIPLASPGEIFHVDTLVDPETQKEIVMWEDILQAFDNAVQVRHKNRVIPFLRGKDLRVLEPRRIATVPNIVLDVVVDDPVINQRVSYSKVQQLAIQPLPPKNEDSSTEVEIVSQDTTSSPTNTTSISFAPSSTTPAVRRSPVYGLEETAMDNYSHIDKPHAFTSSRAPQGILAEQTQPNKDPSGRSNLPNGDNLQSQVPQSGTRIEILMEKDLAPVTLNVYCRDKEAQVALGDMYRDGKVVPRDYQAAMDWYLKAAEQGDAFGQHRVGFLYSQGLGVPKDYSTAMNWYLKAANQGDARSQCNIGLFYNLGQGVLQDYRLAMVWYLKAAKQGNAVAQHNIGIFYDYGHVVEKDYGQAMYWYLKAANQDDASAQFNIGLYHNWGRGVPQDYAQAMTWYLKAANQGHVGSQYNIGLLYHGGHGVAQNYIQAREWFLKAAVQGSGQSQFYIGLLHNYGQGVPQDYAQAMDWYLKAAEQEFAVAQYHIGILYKDGHGVSQDYTEAAKWFQKAAEQGNLESQKALEELRKEGVLVA